MNEPLDKQLSLLHSVAKTLDNFKKIGRNNYTPAKIRSRMTSLKETWNKCIQGHAVLLQIYMESKREAVPYFKEEQMDAHEEIYQATLDFMTEQLEELEPCVSPNRSLDQSYQFKSESSLSLKHLPPIQLPPFSGNAQEWENFRDRFDALIIQNKELSDFSRMHFLMSSLNGRARDAIAGTAVTADNFAVAWKALVARFENKSRLIELHVASLYNLRPASRENAFELHALRDTVDRAISALKRLDRTSDDMLNDFLVYFVTLKIDPATRRAWKLKCSGNSSPPDYEELNKFLSARAIALEELSPLRPQGPKNVKVNNATALNNNQVQCALCKNSHLLNKCSQFLSKSPSQRREFVKQTKRCFNCLSVNHAVQECKSKFTCRSCQKRHHSLLHVDSVSSSRVNLAKIDPIEPDKATTTPEAAQAVAMSSVSSETSVTPVLLATAKVTISSPTGRSLNVRALIDQGSEVTFITENLAQTLRLRRTRTLTTISAVGCVDAGTCRHAALVKITPRNQVAPIFTTVAFVLKSLTKYNPRVSIGLQQWKHLAALNLADDDPTGSHPVDIIIGADLYSSIILDGIRKGSIGQPIAQNSHLGWLISGPIQIPTSRQRAINVFHCSLEQEIRRFWEIEEIPRRAILSPEEARCENHFVCTHSRAPDGKYIVRLPFKKEPPLDIGESRQTALQRLSALKRRLNANPEMKSEYTEFLSAYENLHHMEKVTAPTSLNYQAVYIPHLPVIRSSSATTRLRVVFNASSLTRNGTSLNDHLEAGPKLQTDLVAVLLRWRQHKYVYSADIAKMYRQIWIDPRDSDFQRIVWYNEDFTEAQDYRLLTITYGTVSAPFLALRVLKQLVIDEGPAFPIASQILHDHMYVDDVLFGAEDIPSLRQARTQVCQLLSRGGFTLRKWASNHSDLLKDIPAEDHGLAGSRTLQPDDSLNVLGISWSPASDSFQFRVSLPELLPRTKRQILSTIAKLFDPFGWVTPVTVNAKIFMQQLWKLKLDWDDVVSPPIIDQWEAIFQTLSQINGLQVPRWTGREHDATHCELHGFSDASTVAYAAAVYMRVTTQSREVTISLLASKSKVAPIKPMTIPRLELSAAALLARLLEVVRVSLNITHHACYCWTDSTVVLSWLKSDPSKLQTFVSHRVADVQARVPTAEWRHVPTNDNPADCASRGLLKTELKSFLLWWYGPSWLRLSATAWPARFLPSNSEISEEARKPVVHSANLRESWDLATRYSTWPKLIRVTAYIIRFVKCCKLKIESSKKSSSSLPLSSEDCDKARIFWIKTIQSEVLKSELQHLKTHQLLPSKNSITSLMPFLDHEGVIRVGGRLKNSPVSFNVKHPVLLAPHPIVRLIVRHMHIRSLHSGVQLTLATLRQEYWLLKARTIVKQIIYQCVACTRERAAVPSQLMGQLPQPRISTPTRSFSHCGLDYAGPVLTRASSGRGIQSRKGYIAVFICLASRAIHLELVSTYSTLSFLDAFSRFCSRRGLPSTVYSDNGTTFIGADTELKKAYRNAIRDPNFQNRTAIDNVAWKFIPPHAPHFGGLWESGVRSLKHHLRRTLGSHTLTFEEFTTLLCRIEACLNSRPIGPLKDTLDDYEALTPGHFLIGSAITVNPEPSVLSIPENRVSRWQLIRRITERFWKIWQNDYVNTLQQRSKWRRVQPSIKTGTLVLLRNPLLPPCKWELGRVTQCHAGPDGLVRVVSVRTAHSEYKRPLVKLCILPLDLELQPDVKSVKDHVHEAAHG